ncbi:MAG TPA: glutamine amidotransferase [Acidimicrobiia bacterium]|jgi:hypothetical protein|nr:glutamine amidotransferase [Acidimicrobiia bacterium]
MSVSIAIIYQDLLGTYGDRGNALALAYRAGLQNIDSEIVQVGPGDKIPKSCDIYLLGGGEDNAQTLATSLLLENKKTFENAIEKSLLVAICAGFQILGKQFPISDGKFHQGLDMIDATTQPGSPRIIGEVLTQSVIPEVGLLTGFENHGGRTILSNNANAFGTVISGMGNGIDTNSKFVDGYFSESIICSYLHGPLLARNPKLCDYILAKATNVNFSSLKETRDDTAAQLHSERLQANS